MPSDEDLIRKLLMTLGEDPDREGLKETPKRVLSAWKYWMSGYDMDAKKILKTFHDGATDYDELIFEGGIPFVSHCEHHMAPFFGVVHIGYIPEDEIVGLSKLVRLVEMYALRLQVQERMTVQIAKALEEHTNALVCSSSAFAI